jgi:hypothetical protein
MANGKWQTANFKWAETHLPFALCHLPFAMLFGLLNPESKISKT